MNTRRILKVVVVAEFLSMAFTNPIAEGSWTRKSDMPTARIWFSTSVVSGKIYAIGGGPSATAPYLSTVEVYDPVAETWTRKRNMPTARDGHAASVVNGKIYVIGGEPTAQASLATVEEYDPATDTWTQKADMPSRRTFLSACTVDGKIYAFGGALAGVAELTEGDRFLSALEIYDPATDTWTRGADMMTPRAGAAAVTVDGKIYVIGGVFGNLHNAPLPVVEAYDPVTDTWTRKANMPTARMFLSASVVGGRIYAIGGGVWSEAIYSTVEVYDPATDRWTRESDMPTARHMHSASVVSGRIYVIGGTREWFPGPGISTVEEYDLSPLVDFNGDGSVDGKDLLILAGYWGTDEPICDIAPPPYGDGLVDLQDVIVLAEYIGQEVQDGTLLAHWRFDEEEGPIACDSSGGHDGTVIGVPAWQPAGGAVGGALEFDGATFVVADAVLNPRDGIFSVFAWVNGGAPGEVILSQQGGVSWLMLDPATGALMTELRSGARQSKVLPSDAVITDGNWHRVGFNWDGTNRRLYVDDILVAEDTDVALADSSGGLNIGCGKDMAPGSFFSGLIDDVRIYNRAVKP